MQDAMGDVFRTNADAQGSAQNALYVSEKTGIPLSATLIIYGSDQIKET